MARLNRPCGAAVLGCAFLMAPPVATAYTYDPPSWFNDGVTLIKKRGGTCEPYKTTRMPDPYGTETVVEEGVDCHHVIPRELAEEFGQNPARGEGCAGQATDVTGEPGSGTTPSRNSYGYGCRIFARPGTDAKPYRASWPCDRNISVREGEPTFDAPRWIAPKTRLYRKQTFTTLKQCLNKHLRAKRKKRPR